MNSSVAGIVLGDGERSENSFIGQHDRLIDVSIVIPVYRGKATLRELTDRIKAVMDRERWTAEIIFVDDASPDGAWGEIVGLQPTQRVAIRGLRHMQNMGQHSALLSGIRACRGKTIVTMDDDLQQLPEAIPQLVAPLSQGFDLSIASYREKKHSRMRNASGELVDRVLRRIYDLDPTFQLTSFRAFTRPVCDAVRDLSVAFPYVTAMLLSQSGLRVNVLVDHNDRTSGTSNYDFIKSLRLAANLIFNYSSIPIYLLFFLAALQLSIGILGSSIILIRSFVGNGYQTGWASLMLCVILFNSITTFSVFVIGIYVKRIYQQTTHSTGRPAVGAVHG
jgi:glycosyltransferase involved in cell wall biosynthesis